MNKLNWGNYWKPWRAVQRDEGADRGRDRALHEDADLGRDRAWHGGADLGRDRALHRGADLGHDRACTGGLFSVGDRRVQGERSNDFGVGADDDKDNLKAVSVTLPQLPPHSGQESGIACGDWLVQVRPLIGDISGGALQWWDDVLRTVTAQYNRWLLADPLQRLHLPSPADVEYTTLRRCGRGLTYALQHCC